MRSLRLTGVFLVAATVMGFNPSTVRADMAFWSTSAAACVPASAFGLNVTAGAVAAAGGAIVTLSCPLINPAGVFDTIEITYKGGGFVMPPQGSTGDVNTMAAAILNGGLVTADLIEVSKATGAETVKCEVQSKGSSTIVTERNLCQDNKMDPLQNVYYVRIVVKSGFNAAQQATIYGASLISTR
jgi:hypothetical protein